MKWWWLVQRWLFVQRYCLVYRRLSSLSTASIPFLGGVYASVGLFFAAQKGSGLSQSQLRSTRGLGCKGHSFVEKSNPWNKVPSHTRLDSLLRGIWKRHARAIMHYFFVDPYCRSSLCVFREVETVLWTCMSAAT